MGSNVRDRHSGGGILGARAPGRATAAADSAPSPGQAQFPGGSALAESWQSGFPVYPPLLPARCARSASRTQTVGRLIYGNNDHRVQRQNLVLAWPRPMVLRYRSGEAEPRPESHIRIRDLWLGNDSGRCSDRQNRVEDFHVSQGWPLHCAHQSECPKSRKS